MTVRTLATTPYADQKPGTSGLRKRVKVFQQPNYVENFVQAGLQALSPSGPANATLVVGGDGRFFVAEAVLAILRVCGGNGVRKVVVGKDGILSTPAASHLIRKLRADGGILCTASHNPGGPDADFGIKFNTASGGPAPEGVTDRLFAIAKTVTELRVIDIPSVCRHSLIWLSASAWSFWD